MTKEEMTGRMPKDFCVSITPTSTLLTKPKQEEIKADKDDKPEWESVVGNPMVMAQRMYLVQPDIPA